MFLRRFQFGLSDLMIFVMCSAIGLAILLYAPLDTVLSSLFGCGVIGSGLGALVTRRSLIERMVNGLMFGMAMYVLFLVIVVACVAILMGLGHFPAQN